MRRSQRALTGLGIVAVVALSGPAAASVTATPTQAAATTTTTLSSSRVSASYDSRVTLTAHVTAVAGTPAGSVTFADSTNGSILATKTLSSGTASFTTAALAPGTRRIVTRYAGNSTFAASTSPAVSIPIAAAGSVAVGYQINARHDGNQNHGQLRASSLTKKWRVDLVNGYVSYPLIAGGRVFVVTQDGGLFALSAADGHTEWRAPNIETITYDGQNVFALANSGTLTAFTASTGNKLWTIQRPHQGDFTAPPTAYDGVVYISGSGVGGSIYAVSEADGRLRWEVHVLNGDASSPAVDDSGVYVSYAEHQDYRLRLDGTPVWHYAPSGEGAGGSTPALHAGSVYTRGDAWERFPNNLVKGIREVDRRVRHRLRTRLRRHQHVHASRREPRRRIPFWQPQPLGLRRPEAGHRTGYQQRGRLRPEHRRHRLRRFGGHRYKGLERQSRSGLLQSCPVRDSCRRRTAGNSIGLNPDRVWQLSQPGKSNHRGAWISAAAWICLAR
jgi:outer membrane protein assembly factor BamB